MSNREMGGGGTFLCINNLSIKTFQQTFSPYTHTHARTHARTHTRTHTHTHTHARTYAHARTPTRTHTHTHAHTRTRTHAHARTYASIHANSSTLTHARTHTRENKNSEYENSQSERACIAISFFPCCIVVLPLSLYIYIYPTSYFFKHEERFQRASSYDGVCPSEMTLVRLTVRYNPTPHLQIIMPPQHLCETG